MPIYEYLCRSCNRIYSFLIATMTDAGAPSCPRCGAAGLERTLSSFAFVRGGTDPLAAIPKPPADAPEPAGADTGGGAADAGPPVRDDGLYRLAWDGTYERLRERPE